MRWFEHQANARTNKKFRKIERQYREKGGDEAAMAAIGRVWRLLELIAHMEDDGNEFALPEDYDLDLLADDLRCSKDYLEEFLDFLASVNFIDAEAWQRKAVYCPKMAERADTYKKQKMREGASSKKVQRRFEETTNEVPPTLPDPIEPDLKEPDQTGQQQDETKDFSSNGGRPDLGKSNSELEASLTPKGLIDLYNEISPIQSMKRPVQATEKRLEKARTRLKSNPTYGYWLEVFTKVKTTQFLNGSTKTWGADIDWLLANDDNHAKVWEGKYDRPQPQNPNGPSRGKYSTRKGRQVIDLDGPG